MERASSGSARKRGSTLISIATAWPALNQSYLRRVVFRQNPGGLAVAKMKDASWIVAIGQNPDLLPGTACLSSTLPVSAQQ